MVRAISVILVVAGEDAMSGLEIGAAVAVHSLLPEAVSRGVRTLRTALGPAIARSWKTR
jgi:hypothetical protein